MVQIAEIEFSGHGGVVSMTNAQATNPGGNNPTNEEPEKAIDGDTSSKWLDFNVGALVVEWSTGVASDSFRFVTANDFDERDPVQWTLEGFDGSVWKTLHSQTTDYATASQRFTPTPWFNFQMQATGGRRLQAARKFIANTTAATVLV